MDSLLKAVALLLGALEEAHKKLEMLEGALGEAKRIFEEVVEEEEEDEEGVEEASIRKTILVMDSHVKSLNTRLSEEELGGLLFRGQFSCERRAYNSGEWPRAKFPKIKISNQFFP